MPGPKFLHVKRRADEEPLELLVLDRDRSSKRRATENFHYVRKRAQDEQPSQKPNAQTQAPADVEKRILRLKRRREGTQDEVATFIEKRAKRTHLASEVSGEPPLSDEGATVQVLKRPSRRAAVKRGPEAPPVNHEKAVDHGQVQALADYMHQAALEQVERESRPKAVAKPTPRLSGQRSREIHNQRAATNHSADTIHDVEMEDEGEYVLDTYVLAPNHADAQNEFHNVGYLVITEEDRSIWESYLDNDPESDKNEMSDEDDENAEDYYGADYPEDDLVSDDEYDRNAYAFRNGAGSDHEEWDEDTGAYSDEEYERMMDPFNAWKSRQGFKKYLRGQEADND